MCEITVSIGLDRECATAPTRSIWQMVLSKERWKCVAGAAYARVFVSESATW